MGLDYAIQDSRTLLNGSTLTASYAGNTDTVRVDGMSQVVLYISYTASEADRTLSIKIEAGTASDDVYQTITTSASSGTQTVNAEVFEIAGTNETAVKRRIPIPVADKYLKISIKEDGSNHGTVTAKLTVSGK
jgi:hypothetical protein